MFTLFLGPNEIVVFHNTKESVFHKDEDGIARELAEKVKVLCWVMTQPDNHKSKVQIETFMKI